MHCADGRGAVIEDRESKERQKSLTRGVDVRWRKVGRSAISRRAKKMLGV